MADSTLKQLRELLGFNAAEVAATGGWSRRDFKQLERSDSLDVEDGLKLSDLYGVDVARVLEKRRICFADAPIAALLKGNANDLTADARFAMTEAMSVARDVRALEKALGITPRISVKEFRESRDRRHPKSGIATRLAAEVRAKLGLDGVIPSLVNDVCRPLGIVVFLARFRDRLIDAFSAWSSATGPLIVINSDSPNCGGPLGLRTTIAHELCHLLFDRTKMRDIQMFCEVEQLEHTTWTADEEWIERRTRAFQVELIAPQYLVQSRWHDVSVEEPFDGIAALALEFGVGPIGMARQLSNAGALPYDGAPVVAPQVDAWPELLEINPSPDASPAVPDFRRGYLCDLVRDATIKGTLSSSWGRELLRVGIADWDALVSRWMSS